jgi:hypothetical protein
MKRVTLVILRLRDWDSMYTFYPRHSTDKSWPREDEAERKELVRLSKLISSGILGFKARMEEFMESPEDLDELCFMVRTL